MYTQVNIIQLQYFKPADLLLFALVKRNYKSWLNSELAMENTPPWVIKIMDSISSVTKNALISCWKKIVDRSRLKSCQTSIKSNTNWLFTTRRAWWISSWMIRWQKWANSAKKINKKVEMNLNNMFSVQTNIININFVQSAMSFLRTENQNDCRGHLFFKQQSIFGPYTVNITSIVCPNVF